MKSNNGLQIIIRITVCVTMLSSLIGAFMLHSTPSHRESGSVLILVSVAAAVLWVLEEVVFHNHTRKYVAKLSTMISKTERDSLLNFPAPAIIIDSENVIVWYNRLFGRQVYSEEEAYGIDLTELMNIDMDKIYSSDGDLVCINAHFYKAKAIHTDVNGELSMVYFNDVTDYVELEYEFRMSHKAVIIITIDNFDELMSNIRESEKAHVVVEIEKLIEEFLENTTAVSKKVASDKFYVYMEERHLAPIIEQRFKILEQARKIAVGERSNLTLSIGVGRDGANLAESEKFAKQALEMCLGRGGDQAAVKEDGEFKFFGGISSAPDKNNKTRIRMVAKAMLELICNHDKVLIMGHRFGDLDSVGSSVGLTCAIRNLGKSAWAVCDYSTSLAKVLIDRFPHVDGEEPLFTEPADAMEELTDNSMLIICDTHNPLIIESKELYEKAKKVVVIDHHRKMVNYIDNAVIFHHEPYASSASEMVTELIQYFGEAGKLRAVQAECLLAGIMLDTKNFVMKTGVRTFEAAAVLRKMGADTITVKKMFSSSIDSYKRKTQIVAEAEIYRKCAIAPCDFYADDLRIVAPQAADELLTIKNVDASFVLFKTMSNEISISARSMGNLNVQLIMEALGGGGHQTMAGAQLKDVTVNEALNTLKKSIDDYYLSLIKVNSNDNKTAQRS